jgi:hypothetical protein
MVTGKRIENSEIRNAFPFSGLSAPLEKLTMD